MTIIYQQNTVKSFMKRENKPSNKSDIYDVHKEKEYNNTKIKNKKTFRFINKIQILFIKLIFFNNLLPFYLSGYNSKERRILSSNPKISVLVKGKGNLTFISQKYSLSKIKNVEVNGKTYSDKKSLNFLYEGEHNVTIYFYDNILTTLFIDYTLENIFNELINITKVDLSGFYKKAVDTSYMFKNCKNLENIIFGNFDTSKVTNMAHMFSGTGVKLLDLSKFDTSSVSNMNYMFHNNKELISLDLTSFDTSKVTKMENMFYSCESLLFINLYSFKENTELNIEKMFDFTKDDLFYCINDKMDKIQNALSQKKNENMCDHDCFKSNKKIVPEKKICVDNCNDTEYLYEKNNICYNSSINDSLNKYNISEEIEEEILFNETDKTNELINNCTTEEFFKGLCDIKNKTLSTENKDNMINTIIDNIISGNLNSLLTEIVNGENDFYIKEDDVVFQITTSDNQKNNEYNNVSTIDLGECEDVLKEKYHINKSLPLIILKIDYFMEGLLIPIIGYEVFDPINRTKLDLSYCKDFLINYNIPVSINEDNLEKYDPNSSYYNDECTSTTSEDGTDITINDRQIEYNENNMSLCESNCTFTEYNSNSKKSVCMCEIKSKIYTISEILESKETVSKDFNTDKTTSSSTSSVSTMKCFNTLFSKYGLLKNIGNYILLLIIVVFSVSSIFFYKVGYNLLENEMKQILLLKEKDENNVNIYQFEHKSPAKIKKKKKKRKSKKSIISVYNPNKKSIKKKLEAIDSNNTGKDINVYKSISKIEFKNHNIINNQVNSPQNSDKISNNLINEKYSDFELNNFTYKDALEKDKRTFIQYYISLMKLKHPLIFSFFPMKDYNTMIIKIDIFLISFAVCYAMNALFFNESTIHHIYEDKGEYKLPYFFPKIVLAFILSHIVVVILKYFFLSERDILVIKYKETRTQASEQVDKVKRCLIIKYIIFYVAGALFLILFWYYLSSFCAVYQNSQIFLIINTFISFAISLFYPFIINLIPVVIRSFSLSSQNRQWIYKTNKIIQIL